MHNTLHHNLAKLKDKKQGKRVRDVQAEAFSDTLSNWLVDVKVGKYGETLTKLKVASLVLMLFPTLAVMNPAHRSAHPV